MKLLQFLLVTFFLTYEIPKVIAQTPALDKKTLEAIKTIPKLDDELKKWFMPMLDKGLLQFMPDYTLKEYIAYYGKVQLFKDASFSGKPDIVFRNDFIDKMPVSYFEKDSKPLCVFRPFLIEDASSIRKKLVFDITDQEIVGQCKEVENKSKTMFDWSNYGWFKYSEKITNNEKCPYKVGVNYQADKGMRGFVFVPTEVDKKKKWAKVLSMGREWYFNTGVCANPKFCDIYFADTKKKFNKYEEEWSQLVYQTDDHRFKKFFESVEKALSSKDQKLLLDLVFIDPKPEEDGEWYEQMNGPMPFKKRPESLSKEFIEEFKECMKRKEIVGFDGNFHYRGKHKVCTITRYPGKLMILNVSYPECHLDGIPEGYEKPLPN